MDSKQSGTYHLSPTSNTVPIPTRRLCVGIHFCTGGFSVWIPHSWRVAVPFKESPFNLNFLAAATHIAYILNSCIVLKLLRIVRNETIVWVVVQLCTALKIP